MNGISATCNSTAAAVRHGGFPAATYPADARQNCGFGIRYMRWLYESGAAAELGPDAVAILSAVLTLEDAFHYQRAPNFYNAQLMDRCGFRSEHAFIRARQIAIDAGLLVYEPGRKRTPGRYFVCGFTAQSAGKAEGNEQNPPGFTAQSAAEAGRNQQDDPGFTAQSAAEAGRKPDESRTKAGPSIPHTPYPIPKPLTQREDAFGESPSSSSNGKTATKKFDPGAIEIPPPLRTERFRDAWRDWIAHRKEIRKPLMPTATRQQLKTLAAWGESRAVSAIEHTIAMGWTGLREPDDRPGPETKTSPKRVPGL